MQAKAKVQSSIATPSNIVGVTRIFYLLFLFCSLYAMKNNIHILQNSSLFLFVPGLQGPEIEVIT